MTTSRQLSKNARRLHDRIDGVGFLRLQPKIVLQEALQQSREYSRPVCREGGRVDRAGLISGPGVTMVQRRLIFSSSPGSCALQDNAHIANMCPMRCGTKNKLPRVVSGLIVASMLLTISGQVLLLASADEESSVAPWVITLLATVVLVWAVFQLFRTHSLNKQP